MLKRAGSIGLAVALAMAVAACGRSEPDHVAVKYAWVRLSPVAGRPAALYFTLTGAARPDRLIAIDSPAVPRIELHRSMAGGGMAGGAMAGMMTMKPLAGVDVAPGTSLAFAPGGRHAMLFGVPATTRPGDTLRFRFRFAGGAAVAADARAVAAGDAAPAG